MSRSYTPLLQAPSWRVVGQLSLFLTVPNKTIYSIITQFEETDCVIENDCRRAVLNDDTLEDVRHSLLQFPSKSLRKLSQQKNISLGSAFNVVQLLHLRACRIHAMHELRPTDHATRLRYCNWFKAFVRNNI
jgi:hypothetical protein